MTYYFFEYVTKDGQFNAMFFGTETLDEAKSFADEKVAELGCTEWQVRLAEDVWAEMDDTDEDEGCGGCDSCSCYEDDEA